MIAALLLAGIAFVAELLAAGAALAFFQSRLRPAVWLGIGIPYTMVLVAGMVVSIAGFRDPHSGLSYINLQLRLLIMACFVSGASAAGLLLLLMKRK